MTRDRDDASPRRFTIADAMILIAGLFAAAAWDRPRVLDPLLRVSEPAVVSWSAAEAVASLLALVLQVLVVASLTVLILRLRPPWPAPGRLLRQPGLVACAVASVASLAIGLAVLGSHLTSRSFAAAWSRAAVDLEPDKLLIVAPLVGMAIATAWVVMHLRRQWRPEPGWIDRLGRLVGAGWIAMIPGGMFLLLLRFVGLARSLR